MSLVGLVVVLTVLLAATGYGLARRRVSGRLRDVPATDRDDGQHLSSAQLGGRELGDRATLVQFSSAFCRPCVATRHLLADVAAKVPGVRHVEVDAESHLDLVRTLGIATTPTTLLLDGRGVVRRRAVGVPRRDEVLGALARVVD
jgi:thiol-disulfide isomerase/thioredoxin